MSINEADPLWVMFCEETNDILDGIESDAEQAFQVDQVIDWRKLYRQLHTIKGNTGFVEEAQFPLKSSCIALVHETEAFIEQVIAEEVPAPSSHTLIEFCDLARSHLDCAQDEEAGMKRLQVESQTFCKVLKGMVAKTPRFHQDSRLRLLEQSFDRATALLADNPSLQEIDQACGTMVATFCDLGHEDLARELAQGIQYWQDSESERSDSCKRGCHNTGLDQLVGFLHIRARSRLIAGDPIDISPQVNIRSKELISLCNACRLCPEGGGAHSSRRRQSCQTASE